MNIEWLSTEPNPRTSGMNAAGGWKIHAVDTDVGVAACGMRPAHGWGMDLFITDKCARCKKALGGRND